MATTTRPSSSYWGKRSDAVLRPLFAEGREPTQPELTKAYPFEVRRGFAYQVWLRQVAWWKEGCPVVGRRAMSKPLAGQEGLGL